MSFDGKDETNNGGAYTPPLSSYKIRYVHGDATKPIGNGNKILIHCCNSIGAWGSGFVMAISRRWKEPEVQYKKWSRGHVKGLRFGLGQVQFVKVENDIIIGDMIGQKGIRSCGGQAPIRYSAIAKCLEKIKVAAIRNNASIHAPKFGSDRAGGSWVKIEGYIKDILCNNGIEVTIYEL